MGKHEISTARHYAGDDPLAWPSLYRWSRGLDVHLPNVMDDICAIHRKNMRELDDLWAVYDYIVIAIQPQPRR